MKLIIEKSSQNNEIISDVALNDAANEFGEISDDGISIILINRSQNNFGTENLSCV